MAESNRAIVERFLQALVDKDFATAVPMLADDVIDEMPQSGERIRGKANWIGAATNYPGGVGTIDPDAGRVVGAEDQWVLTPSLSVVRIEGSGDVFTYAGSIAYPNGETWHVIAIAELRDGKIARTTTFYGAPFEAPAWRAPYVERF